MISWGLRCFPSNGDRSAVVVLAGPSPEERREVGRLVLDAGEIEDLRARLADRPMTGETELEWVTDTAQKWRELVASPDWLRLWLAQHGLSDSVGPAAVLAAVAVEYQGYAVVLARRELDTSRGSVQSSPVPEFCHYCGPGYRYGSEGCRHTPPAEAHRCDALCRDVEDERDRLLADAERMRPVVEAAKALRAAQRRDVIDRPITVHDLLGRAEEFRAVRETFAAAVDAYEGQERGTDA